MCNAELGNLWPLSQHFFYSPLCDVTFVLLNREMDKWVWFNCEHPRLDLYLYEHITTSKFDLPFSDDILDPSQSHLDYAQIDVVCAPFCFRHHPLFHRKPTRSRHVCWGRQGRKDAHARLCVPMGRLLDLVKIWLNLKLGFMAETNWETQIIS